MSILTLAALCMQQMFSNVGSLNKECFMYLFPSHITNLGIKDKRDWFLSSQNKKDSPLQMSERLGDCKVY